MNNETRKCDINSALLELQCLVSISVRNSVSLVLGLVSVVLGLALELC